MKVYLSFLLASGCVAPRSYETRAEYPGEKPHENTAFVRLTKDSDGYCEAGAIICDTPDWSSTTGKVINRRQRVQPHHDIKDYLWLKPRHVVNKTITTVNADAVAINRLIKAQSQFKEGLPFVDNNNLIFEGYQIFIGGQCENPLCTAPRKLKTTKTTNLDEQDMHKLKLGQPCHSHASCESNFCALRLGDASGKGKYVELYGNLPKGVPVCADDYAKRQVDEAVEKANGTNGPIDKQVALPMWMDQYGPFQFHISVKAINESNDNLKSVQDRSRFLGQNANGVGLAVSKVELDMNKFYKVDKPKAVCKGNMIFCTTSTLPRELAQSAYIAFNNKGVPDAQFSPQNTQILKTGREMASLTPFLERDTYYTVLGGSQFCKQDPTKKLAMAFCLGERDIVTDGEQTWDRFQDNKFLASKQKTQCDGNDEEAEIVEGRDTSRRVCVQKVQEGRPCVNDADCGDEAPICSVVRRSVVEYEDGKVKRGRITTGAEDESVEHLVCAKMEFSLRESMGPSVPTATKSSRHSYSGQAVRDRIEQWERK